MLQLKWATLGSSRKLCQYVGLLCLALLATSCGGPGESDEGPPGSPRKIIYWEKWTGFEGEAMGRVVKLFNARQKERAAKEAGYRPIEVKQVTVSKIDQKLMVAIAGGNPPDVAGSISFWLPAFVDKGALVDITDQLARAGLDKNHFSPAFYDLGAYRGRMWATPTTPSGLALYYNERLFREAGLDPNTPPKTIEELDAFAEKMTKWEVTHEDGHKSIERGYQLDVPSNRKRLIQIGFLPSEPGLWQWAWGFYFGGQLVRGDKITAAEPANVRAFEWVASYSKNLGVDTIQRFRSSLGNTASTVASPQNPFLAGKVAMEVQGVWMFNFIEQYAPALEWKAAAFPHPADRPDLFGPTDVDADQLVIPTGSRHPAEAFEFIAFASSQEAMEILCLGQKKHSPLLVMSDEFRTKHPHPYLELFHSLSSSPGRYSAPRVGVYNEYLRALVGAIDEIQNLRTPPKQALEAVQVRVQRAYDRELASTRRRNPAGAAREAQR